MTEPVCEYCGKELQLEITRDYYSESAEYVCNNIKCKEGD